MLDIVLKFKIPQKWHKGEQMGKREKKWKKSQFKHELLTFILNWYFT